MLTYMFRALFEIVLINMFRHSNLALMLWILKIFDRFELFSIVVNKLFAICLVLCVSLI